MLYTSNRKKVLLMLISLILVGTVFTASAFEQIAVRADNSSDKLEFRQAQVTEPAVSNSIYLPFVSSRYPWRVPYGVESNMLMTTDSVFLNRSKELGIGWARLNGRISWRALQPNETDEPDWSLLANFENELRELKAASITPIVVVDDYPRWATIEETSCGALRQDKLSAFASFMSKLVKRYSTPEFNVRHWEMGNEPDVDPSQVGMDGIYGCWGDINDPYFGGRYYGEMLKVVTPAIRKADPSANVWIGGLLLWEPVTKDKSKGKPELFFEGILISGAAPFFDVVPYHWYTHYGGQKFDYDLVNNPWSDSKWGGGARGKARFLRETMQRYGINKPVFLNEFGFGCIGTSSSYCTPEDFHQAQADFIIRTVTRARSENIMGFIWYTLNDQRSWRDIGLLGENQTPKPVFDAYKLLSSLTQDLVYLGPFNYANAKIEGYRFGTNFKDVRVLWAIQNETVTLSLPQAELADKTIYDRQGNIVTPVLDNGMYKVNVSFSPIFMVKGP